MPIPPTNTSPAAAFDLTGLMPFNDTIDLSGLANPQKVWFKFTLSGQFGIGAWVEGITTSPFFLYRPKIKFYKELPADPTTGILQDGTATNIVEFFLEESIAVPSTGIIYISIENGYIGVEYIPDQPITIKFQLTPNTALPAGAPLISNDISGYPATLLHPNGTPTQLRSFIPHGESAAVLTNGISLWSEGYPDHTKLWLYDENILEITSLTWSFRNRLRSPISSNRIDTFYIEGSGKITTVSTTGTIGSITWTVPTSGTITFITPSIVDNDIIYIQVGEGISKFHKSTSVLDAYYIPYELFDITGNWTYYYGEGFYGNEFLVLPGDNIITMYTATNDNPDRRAKAILYSPTGTVIRTYFADFEDINRITYGVDYTTFWMWTYNDLFESQLIEFRISDGVRLHEFTLDTTSSSNGFASETEPTFLFGVPESCPFIIFPPALPPYGGGPDPEPLPAEFGGIYFINPAKAHDTYYPAEKKIPNPTIKTALIGE
jgi:hypothetical protein